MSKRINIVLPETTVRTIDRMTRPGERSQFINEAVRHFVATRSMEAFRAQLERAAVRDRDLDRDVAADWSGVDQESWQQLDTLGAEPKRRTQNAAKSTSRRLTRRQAAKSRRPGRRW
jgi:Arc/MetJ-type ribon-helix-helix transcriptional regulator